MFLLVSVRHLKLIQVSTSLASPYKSLEVGQFGSDIEQGRNWITYFGVEKDNIEKFSRSKPRREPWLLVFAWFS